VPALKLRFASDISAPLARLVYHRIRLTQIESFRLIVFHYVLNSGRTFDDSRAHATLNRCRC